MDGQPEAVPGGGRRRDDQSLDRIARRRALIDVWEFVGLQRIVGQLGECRWARVLTFEPPNQLVFRWGISPQWQLESDLEKTSEVEVRFSSEAAGRTRVELEHRNLDRHGYGWEAERDGVAGEGGWPLYLQRFAALLRD